MPPGAHKKAEPGLSQQPNSSLEADLVVDVVNYLSKVGEIYFVLNKLVIRKKKRSYELDHPFQNYYGKCKSHI